MTGGPGVRRAGARILHITVLTVFTVGLAFPFFWMFIATFKQNIDLYTVENNPFKFNLPPTLDHLKLLFGETRFVRWLGNTALVGAIVVAITLVLALPAAYALTRLTGRWGERLGIGIFLTYLIPPTLLFIPLSRVVAILGLQDTIWSVVLVYPSMTIPFSIWLLMGFFKSIPKELEDAAMVDGLTRFGAFIRMVVPISVSGILTVVIFSFTLGDAGIRLRADVSFRPNRTRWSAWAFRSSSCAATSTFGDLSWPRASSHRFRSPSCTICSSTASSRDSRSDRLSENVAVACSGPAHAPAIDSVGCDLDRSPGPRAALQLPRREPPPSITSGDFSRRDPGSGGKRPEARETV